MNTYHVSVVNSTIEEFSKTAELVAFALDSACRHGASSDEPEGERYIVISDSAARRMANALRGGTYSCLQEKRE